MFDMIKKVEANKDHTSNKNSKGFGVRQGQTGQNFYQTQKQNSFKQKIIENVKQNQNIN